MPSLHFVDQGAGIPIILLHGFPLDSRMWAAQIDALSADHRVIAPDLRGFGKSQPPAPFTIESFADDVYSLGSEVLADKQRFVLAGLSMGGYIALAYALKYAPTLLGLILLDTKAEADTPEGREQRDKTIQLVREKGPVAVGDVMQPKLLAADSARSQPDLVKRLRAMTDQQPAMTIEYALAAMKSRPDQSPHLTRIDAPTLVVVGEADAITPPAIAESMQRSIPDARLAVIRGAGHMSPMEQPEQVNGAIARFVATLS